MRILMVSPHPVYSPRGTPISVFNRCVALCALGHQVDLVTYPVGEDRPVAGLSYLRASMPGVSSVAVGPSWAKVVLNGAVTVRSVWEAVRGRGRYDVVHTHEEAGLFGPALARLAGVPHVYDMGNDWADVLKNYGLGARNPVIRLAGGLEDAVIRRSDVVIAHFPLIAERVRAATPTPVETVCNISLEADPDPATVAEVRAGWAPEGAKVILYTGTLEPYQGVPLLLESMVSVARSHPEALLVLVGGRPDQMEQLRAKADELGVSSQVRIVGQVPSTRVPACLEAADILVSPRERGSNTPLKIFSYLRSGRPIVATDIVSHTQILDGQSCVLVPPTAAGLAGGIEGLLEDGPLRTAAVEGAVALRSHYGIEQYVEGVAAAYAHVGGGAVEAGDIAAAAARIAGGPAPADRTVDAHLGGQVEDPHTDSPLEVAV
jgi:glycosyltransferase involved in cell wall biosynthesis